MHRTKFSLAIAIGAVFAVTAGNSWSQDSDGVLRFEEPVAHDLYAARAEVNVGATVDGDVVAAGQQVTVAGDVEGDVIVAGRNIEIRAKVDDDLRAAGQHIRVTSPVAGHIVAAGQSITITEDVGDWAWLAGGTVEVSGNVDGDLKVRARQIMINAEIGGDAELIGTDLQLGPHANMLGDVTWRSENNADISPEANIEGNLIEAPPPGIAEQMTEGGGIAFTLTVIIAVIAFYLLFPRPLYATAERIARRPVVSLVLGFVVLACVPILALILVFSPLAAWFGLALLGIYVVVLFLSILTALFALSDLALRRYRSNPATWQALAAIFVTVLAVGLFAQVPYLGVAFVLAIWLLGVGALCWGTWVVLRSGDDKTLPAP